MKPELKKLIVFGVIITIFTTAYATFLNTVIKQGFLTADFLVNWLSQIPKTYLVFLPFVLITGRLTSALVERIFRNAKQER